MIRRILDDRQFVNTLPSPLRDQLRSLARKSFLVFPGSVPSPLGLYMLTGNLQIVIASISAVFGLAITIMQEERALEAKKDGVDG